VETIELPTYVLEKISEISQKTGISVDELKKEYLEIYNDPFVQDDEQFESDKERHRYCVAVLKGRYLARRPVKEYEIIPIGFSSKRITKSGVPQSAIFALVRDGKSVKLRRIVLRDETADLYKEISLFSRYKVKLGSFSSGDLVADNRTKFESPAKVKLTPQDILEKLGIPRVPELAKARKYLSKRSSTGYVDETDWRIVRGIIVRENRGFRSDDTEYGVYTIVDDSLEDEPIVNSDGTIVPPAFTVWVPPELMVYAVESECDFVGTLQVDSKTKEIFMNAYLILPVHAKPKS